MKNGGFLILIMLLAATGVGPILFNITFNDENQVFTQISTLTETFRPDVDVLEENLPEVEVISQEAFVYQKASDYTPGARIEILSNSDFGPANYNFPGTGIQNNPYLIDGYSISDTTGEALIFIKNTTVFFRISNCDLDGQNLVKGISLVNVSHGSIENNEIKECATGISLHAANLNNISKNVILNSTRYGIALTALNTDICNENQIMQNTIFNASIAINLGSGSSQRVNSNSITWNNFFQSRDPDFGHSVDTGINNSFQNNHWDDWIGPDSDSDGYADMPYNVNRPQSCLRFPAASNTRARFSPTMNDVVPVPGNNVTIELWVNPSNLGTGKTFISKNYRIGTIVHSLFLLGYYGNALQIHLDGTVPISLPTAESYGWQHFAVILQQNTVLTETNVTLYRNGQKLASAISNALLGDTSSNRPGIESMRPWYIGAEYDTGYVLSDFFEGQMDEVRIVNRSLTPAEIYQDYASSIPFDFISNGAFNSRNHYPDRQDTLYYAHLDERSGSIVYDSSEYQTLGEVAGSYLWDVDQHAGLYFDGNNDYGNLADFTLNDVFTIELWINPLDTTSSHCILGKHNNAGNVNIFLLFITGGNLWIYDSTNQAAPYNLGAISTGWQHLAVIVFEGPNVSYQCFRDGNYIGSFLSIGAVNLSPTDKLWTIGQDWDSSTASDFFKGSMRGVRFVNRSLSAQEIYEDYTYPNTAYPDRADTVAWYPLTEQTNLGGNIIADYSGNGYNGTVVNYNSQSEAWKQGILNFDTSPRVAPIWINGNDDLAAFSTTGNGTINNPYILEDYYLIGNETSLVEISNTTSHFELRNSVFHGNRGYENLIVLNNVSNGVINNNYVTKTFESGMVLSNTHHIKVTANVLTDITGEAVECISTVSSYNNTYFNNTVSGFYGFDFDTCFNNSISMNTISRCQIGILLAYSFNNSVYGNLVHTVSRGLRLFSSSNNSVSWNKFADSNWQGILIDAPSESNTIEWNYFFDAGISLVSDSGINNVFEYNYWYNHTSPDLVEPYGFVDTPFPIDGGSNQDQYPRAFLGPNMSIISPTSQTYTVPTLAINFSGNGYQYYYYIEGLDSQNQTWTTNTDRTIPADGTYVLHVYGEDPVGYITSRTVSFIIDFLSVISPIPQYYNTNTIPVQLGGNANYNWYFIEEIDAQNVTWTTNTDRILADGTYTLHAYGNDTFNTILHVVVTFSIDTTPPDLTILSPLNTTYANNMITISYTVSDGSVILYLPPNNTPNNTNIPSGFTTPFPNGMNYNITIEAIDHVGNVATNTVIFSVNSAPPVIGIDSPTETTYTGSVDITLTGDVEHLWYYIEDIDTTNQTWTSTVTRNIPSGTYTLYAYGNNSVGVEVSTSVTFTVDLPTTTTTTTTTTIPDSTTTTTTKPKSGTFPSLLLILLLGIPLIIYKRNREKS